MAVNQKKKEEELLNIDDFVTSDVDSIPLLIDMLILEKQMPFVEADSVPRETLENSVCTSFQIAYVVILCCYLLLSVFCVERLV